MALITLGTMFNCISRWEFNEGTAPGLGWVSGEVGGRCQLERKYDCEQKREIDLAEELLARNRSGHARQRAKEAAQNVDDPNYWKENRLAIHLGKELIYLAVRHAQLDGAPIFQLVTVRESSTQKTPRTLALTDKASDWIAEHQPDLQSLLTPVHRPMIVQPKPWTSFSDGGYLVTRLPLTKREPNKRTQRQLKEADLTPVFSAVNAMQNTAFRINDPIRLDMNEGWDTKGPFFGLEKLRRGELPPRLPDDADPDQFDDSMRERSDVHHVNHRIKGAQQVIASRLAMAEQFREYPRIYYPHGRHV
ncbi:MAG TPA: hypothetical protein VGK48_27995 [Terriglobia bacterium]